METNQGIRSSASSPDPDHFKSIPGSDVSEPNNDSKLENTKSTIDSVYA